MIASLPVSDTGNFKCLILVASVQHATAEQFKSMIFNSCQIRDCSGPVWYSKGEIVPLHDMKGIRESGRTAPQTHGHVYS
jgi:uncharacterized protein YfaT (DUF1175 family)